jgi:uncharacterized protein
VSLFTLGGALLMGVMGSTHCVAMCGPLAIVVCAHPGPAGVVQTRRRTLPVVNESSSLGAQQSLAHVGRLATYSGLGLAAGFVGGGVRDAVGLQIVQVVARIAAAAVLVLAGLSVAGLFRSVGALERFGAPLARLSRMGARMAMVSPWRRVAAGLAWGLLPCGLVYGSVGLALLSQSGLEGGATMLVFGIGTLPALLAVHFFAAGFQRMMREARVKIAAGVLLAVAGLVQVGMAIGDARAVGSGGDRGCCAHHASVAQD